MDTRDPVNARLRLLPSVDRLVDAAAKNGDLRRWSRVAAARRVLADQRARLRQDGGASPPDLDWLVRAVRRRAGRLERPWPARVLNATGVVLHTNLGRAPLAQGVAEALVRVARGYSDLELDLETGERGSRLSRLETLLVELSGAEAGLAVNNNAGALLLAVDTLAAGREVIVSRGELVEIGGSFRVPEIMASSRARLREVGTTNRTHLRDYADAIGPDSGLLLKVHRSNFELRGFTAEVRLGDLVRLGRERGVPVVEDRGSGTFLDLRAHGIPEAPVSEGLQAGADLVLFSGDKLLGSVQAGIVLGRSAAVERLRRSPLARALRLDKLSLAALDWTLLALLDGRAAEETPVLRMLLQTPEVLRARAEQLARGLRSLGRDDVSVVETSAPVGGGSLPGVELSGCAVRLEVKESAARFARRLRRGDPTLLVRVQRDALWLDPRTLDDDEVALVVSAFAALH